MVNESVTSLDEKKAIEAIAKQNKHLSVKGIIGSYPDARQILSALQDHHLLVKTDKADASIRFVHQLFQEWFASMWLYDEFIDVVRIDDVESIHRFQKTMPFARIHSLQRGEFRSIILIMILGFKMYEMEWRENTKTDILSQVCYTCSIK